jgi:hypothetical protein
MRDETVIFRSIRIRDTRLYMDVDWINLNFYMDVHSTLNYVSLFYKLQIIYVYVTFDL